jgi:hypothetical protein
LRATGGQRLLRTHHDGIGEAAQQHHQCQNAIHHADAFVIDGSQPFAPQIRPMATHRDPKQNQENGEDHQGRREQRDRLIEGDDVPGEFAE